MLVIAFAKPNIQRRIYVMNEVLMIKLQIIAAATCVRLIQPRSSVWIFNADEES
jgi:hypothetical protein